jgi:thiamine biosynthesis lipoprotein
MLIQLGVTYPTRLAAARDLLDDDLAELDRSCSRFRAESELVAVGEAARHARGPVTLTVSPLLAEAVAVSLRAAQLTDGDVDPTVGGALAALGYDRDFAELARAGARPGAITGGDTPTDHPTTAASKVSVRVIPGWQSVCVDVAARKLTVPPGVQLDLGATVKGWAADRSDRGPSRLRRARQPRR